MEFPDLGKHCFEKNCNMLDFLPMKCDACGNVFCKDHIHYAKHSCEKAYQKDVQVPVCPLCNKPVPSKRSEPPDIAVGEHIDRDCQSDPAIAKRKIYTNRCAIKSCKRKEVIPLTCDNCRKNFCLKHRHPADHECHDVRSSHESLSPAGTAALARMQASNKNSSRTSSKPSFSNAITTVNLPGSVIETERPLRNVAAQISEDEALALAIQKTMSDCNKPLPKDIQEEEDRLLAQALAASEIDQRMPVAGVQRPNKEKNCTVS